VPNVDTTYSENTPTHTRLMTAVDWIVRRQATRVRKRINRFQGRSSD